MHNWASSGKMKIDRANEHIGDLESEIAAFRKRDPYPLIEEPANPYHSGWRLAVREDIPPRWTAIASDAIHNLSASLDILWKRVIPNGNTQRKSYFPVAANTQEAKKRFSRPRCQRWQLIQNVLSVARAMEPQGVFWAIRQFDDADKHDTPTLVAVSMIGLNVDASAIAPNPPPLDWSFVPGPSGRPFVMEDGAIVFTSTPHVNVKPELPFEIVFGESEILDGQSVLPSLKNMTAAVDSLAAAFIARGLLM